MQSFIYALTQVISATQHNCKWDKWWFVQPKALFTVWKFRNPWPWQSCWASNFLSACVKAYRSASSYQSNQGPRCKINSYLCLQSGLFEIISFISKRQARFWEIVARVKPSGPILRISVRAISNSCNSQRISQFLRTTAMKENMYFYIQIICN